jgi:hypothetical protein
MCFVASSSNLWLGPPNHGALRPGALECIFFSQIWDQIFALPAETFPEFALELQGLMTLLSRGSCGRHFPEEPNR